MNYLDRLYTSRWRVRLQEMTQGTDVTWLISKCRITVAQFFAWLSGTMTPTLNQLDIVCDHLGITFEQLVHPIDV